MLCTFGYMVFMIILKWVTPYNPEDAPSIINTMINMVLAPLKVVRGENTLFYLLSQIILYGEMEQARRM